MVVSWRAVIEEVPALAEAVEARFAENTHHILGTIRPDGSPRLSGTEVAIDADQFGLGMMPDSHKLADVMRDPRVEIHSAPLDEKLKLGDAKITGRLIHTGGFDESPGSAFVLDVDRVSLVTVVGDELVFEIWDSDSGSIQRRRR